MIAVTGASGYVGSHCVAQALRREHRVLAVSTQPALQGLVHHRDQLLWHYIREYDCVSIDDWTKRFSGVETVIHCAARVHQRHSATDVQMHRDNVALTKRIANAAQRAGVSRFVFLSSAAVYGQPRGNATFTPRSPFLPGNAYGRSKVEAEVFLMLPHNNPGLRVSIWRPPVVFGLNAPGNMLRLAKLIAKGWPLPFASIHNRRSIVSIKTLVNALFWQLDQEASARPTVWNVADRKALSTTQMVNAIARGMKQPVRNFSMPPTLLRSAVSLIGQRHAAQQLLDDFELDISGLVAAGFNDFADTEAELARLGHSISTASR